MNMKAIMFAGSGLFLSMVATTMWISADMAKIRERELAKRQAECAQQAATIPQAGDPGLAGGAPTGTVDPQTGQLVDGGATGATSNGSCPTPQGGATTSPQAGGVDPATGQPLDTTTGVDPASESVAVDPATGQPLADDGFSDGTGGDPAFAEAPTGAPATTDGFATDPAAAPTDPGAAVDPGTGF